MVETVTTAGVHQGETIGIDGDGALDDVICLIGGVGLGASSLGPGS